MNMNDMNEDQSGLPFVRNAVDWKRDKGNLLKALVMQGLADKVHLWKSSPVWGGRKCGTVDEFIARFWQNLCVRKHLACDTLQLDKQHNADYTHATHRNFPLFRANQTWMGRRRI